MSVSPRKLHVSLLEIFKDCKKYIFKIFGKVVSNTTSAMHVLQYYKYDLNFWPFLCKKSILFSLI